MLKIVIDQDKTTLASIVIHQVILKHVKRQKDHNFHLPSIPIYIRDWSLPNVGTAIFREHQFASRNERNKSKMDENIGIAWTQPVSPIPKWISQFQWILIISAIFEFHVNLKCCGHSHWWIDVYYRIKVSWS